MRIRALSRLTAALLCCGAASAANAQKADYPTSPVHVVVGFAAGGGNDLIARVLADGMSPTLGQPVIVDDKAGAGGILAAEYVTRAAPDGYTLMVAPSGSMSVAEAVYTNLRYSVLRDFTVVAPVSDIPLALVVNAASPIKSVADLVAYTKAHPEKSNYGATSASFQLANELFNQTTGAQLKYVPYKSTGEVVLAILSGEVTAAIVDLPPTIPQIKAGALRALAATPAKRIAELPDVPTLAELGYKDLDISLWNGLFAPKSTPKPVLDRLRDAVGAALALKQTEERYKALSVLIPKTTPSEFPGMIADDVKRWKAVAASAHISLTQ